MFYKFLKFLCIIICVCKDIFLIFHYWPGFHGLILINCVTYKSFKGNNPGFHRLGYITPTLTKFYKSGNEYRNCKLYLEDEEENAKKKIKFPVDDNAPLKDVPIPPWAIEFTGKKIVEEPYVPRHMSQQEIESGIEKYNVEARERSETKHIQEIPCLKLKSYGFKFKQIQPIRHHNGKAFTFFYIHSLHTDVIPVFLNSLRRVAKRHLGAGRITALRIPGMSNEFYSIVGLREDFFELSKNLRGVIFRNVPENATFHNPIIATLRIKGPIIAVAGHLKINDQRNKSKLYEHEINKSMYMVGKGGDDKIDGKENDNINNNSKEDEQNKEKEKVEEEEEEINIEDILPKDSDNEILMNRPYTDKIEIVNKNHYLCSLSKGSYLTMDVKIEYIANYVIPEYGPESLNRDITEDGFIHFCSSCDPVEIFGFQGERRGIDEKSTSEIVTLEVHTDGSTTPRLALLKSATFLLNWFDRTLYALRTRLSRDHYNMLLENVRNTSSLMRNQELNRNLPWNPYHTSEDRVSERMKWFYRKDVKRQYQIDPDSKLAKEEQLKEWESILEDQILYEQRIPPVMSDDELGPEQDIMTRREIEERIKDEHPPEWVFRDPIGPGNFSQEKVLGMDNEPPPLSPETPFN